MVLLWGCGLIWVMSCGFCVFRVLSGRLGLCDVFDLGFCYMLLGMGWLGVDSGIHGLAGLLGLF